MGSADFRMIRPVGVTADGAFSRASPKWVFDKLGTLVQVPVDTLAVTYDPSDLSKAPYALVEPAATNLIAGSETLSAAHGWTGAASVTATSKVYHGVPYQEVAKVTAGGSENRARGFGAVAAGECRTLTLALRAGTATAIAVGLLDETNASVWGLDANAIAAVVSGPGVITAQNGSLFNISNLSAADDTLVEIVRTYVQACTSAVYLYPGTANSSTVGHSNLVTRVQVVSGIDGGGSYIPTTTAPVTRAADIIAPGAGLVYSNVPITEPTYNAGTTYAANALVYDPVKRGVFQSLIAGNVGRALTDTTAWTPQLATNRWRMFDKAVNSQTSAPELLVVAVQPGALVNTSGLLNVAGSRVSVTQTESYYTASKSLVRHEVLNWYDFFYEEPIREGDVVFDGIPPYATSTLIYVVENPGDVAAVGACIIGKSRTIGQTAWDFTGGILSYSSTSTDTFGNLTLVRRDNAKTLNFEVYIPKGFESEAYRLLRDYTDVEMMIIGAEDYSMTYSYGYLGQWSVPVTNSNKTAHIEWKGLV